MKMKIANNNKKGFLKLPDIFRLIILVGSTVFLVLFLRSVSSMNLENFAADQATMDRMIFNSMSGFSYLSPGRTHPGVIDLDKFNQEKLDSSFTISGEKGAQLHLRSFDGTVDRTIYLNEDYGRLSSGTFSDFYKSTSKEPVLIKTATGYLSGAIEVTYVFKT